VDLDGFLERTASGDGFGSKRQPARCSRKTQVRKSFYGKEASAPLHMSASTNVYEFFCRECGVHFNWCCKHHACAGAYVRQVLGTSAYTFAYTLATGCAYALMYLQFGRLALGERGWGVSASLCKHLLLGAGGHF